MSDSDYGLIVTSEVMDGEVVPDGKKFSECISRAIFLGRKFLLQMSNAYGLLFYSASTAPSSRHGSLLKSRRGKL